MDNFHLSYMLFNSIITVAIYTYLSLTWDSLYLSYMISKSIVKADKYKPHLDGRKLNKKIRND